MLKLRIDWNKKGRKIYHDSCVVIENVHDWQIRGKWLEVTTDLDSNEQAVLYIKLQMIDFFAQVPSSVEPRELEFGHWYNKHACRRKERPRR